MTTATGGQLAGLMSSTSLVMLDFDGPVCSVFAGLPASDVAERLRQALRHLGVPATTQLERDDDPLSIYRHSANAGPAVVTAIYNELVAAELEAVKTAAPTPGAVDVLAAAHESGRQVAVVSNNAADAVVAYLRRRDLLAHVDYIAARRTPEPELMKPNPHYLTEAATALDMSAGACTLVGDSVTDIEAAKRAGVGSIGYANKPGKAERLGTAGADVIISTMTDLAAIIRDGQRTD